MWPSWMKITMAKISTTITTTTTRKLDEEELGGMVMLMIEMTSMTSGINPSFKQQWQAISGWGDFRICGWLGPSTLAKGQILSDFSPCSKFENAKSNGKAEPMCINAGNPEGLASSKRENKCLLNFQPRYIPAILLLFSERLFSGSKMFLIKFFIALMHLFWKAIWQLDGNCIGREVSSAALVEKVSPTFTSLKTKLRHCSPLLKTIKAFEYYQIEYEGTIEALSLSKKSN